ncbi:MAG: hypothetical protein AAF485_26410 [Chloroflexota bacterium]
MKRSLFILISAIFIGVTMPQYIGQAARPITQENLNQPRIYAYRDWQSVGVQLQPGDSVVVKAEGTWLYTMEEYHGPSGSRRYQAPAFYPLPNVPGGSLIGRIGEKGQPFYVGGYTQFVANEAGLFYLRIDDDILSDNEGSVTVDITVERDETDAY